jgi:phosphorylcholine metabolism protein LicD
MQSETSHLTLAIDVPTALENLILARDVLVAFNVRYFLMDGTLLGLVRTGEFIEWDTDIDVGVLCEDFTVLSFADYASAMKRKGFKYQLFGVWGTCFIVKWYRKNVTIDICFYFKRSDKRLGYCFYGDEIIELSYPAKLIESLSSIEFHGETFAVPQHKEAVLTRQYGDWRIPRRDWQWHSSPLNITGRRAVNAFEKMKMRISRKGFMLLISMTGRMLEGMRSLHLVGRHSPRRS